jgi:hypothetical protein
MRMKWFNMSLPMREAGMQQVQTCTNLLHPFIHHALKGSEHQAPRTWITFRKSRYTIIRN